MSIKSKTMFFGDFSRRSTKTFNPCCCCYRLLLSIATDDTKKFQCLNIALKRKTGPLVLEFRCRDKFEHFETIANPLKPRVISATCCGVANIATADMKTPIR